MIPFKFVYTYFVRFFRDTNLWDSQLQSYRGCGNFSGSTYTHTGYTGLAFVLV
jgi:hypothetical protein